jgi:hypothetical protein
MDGGRGGGLGREAGAAGTAAGAKAEDRIRRSHDGSENGEGFGEEAISRRAAGPEATKKPISKPCRGAIRAGSTRVVSAGPSGTGPL